MKLELKHLAPYLPYKLKTVNFNVAYLLDKPLISEMIASNIMCFVDGSTESKIVLRPLSDLTKEIEVNGEKFVPCNIFENLYLNDSKWGNNYIGTGIIGVNGLMTNLCIMNNEIIGECHLAIYQLLIEWHFDIFNLIENNLAIDINTLNK